MVINGNSLLHASPIKRMLRDKLRANGVTHGLSEAGYDIRISQEVIFSKTWFRGRQIVTRNAYDKNNKAHRVSSTIYSGNFILASSVEEFNMSSTIMGIVHDKSTWARLGLSVFNTVIEPGWSGYLTLELVYHGQNELRIPANSGIAQVVFHKLTDSVKYSGRYQNQPNKPVSSIRI